MILTGSQWAGCGGALSGLMEITGPAGARGVQK